MIKYHYNLLEDIKRQWYCWEDRKWIKEHNIVYFYPNPLRAIVILYRLLTRSFTCQVDEDVDCYWVTGGNWGGYEEPNKIFICPVKRSPEFIKNVIRHEIIHLKCEPDVQGMTHEEKEAYVVSKQTV